MSRIPHCQSCHLPILWCRTPLGKWMPVDRAPDPEGNCVVDFNDGAPKVSVYGSGAMARAVNGPGVQLRTSHYATCRFADRHRRPTAVAPAVPEPQPDPYEQGVLL